MFAPIWGAPIETFSTVDTTVCVQLSTCYEVSCLWLPVICAAALCNSNLSFHHCQPTESRTMRNSYVTIWAYDISQESREHEQWISGLRKPGCYIWRLQPYINFFYHLLYAIACKLTITSFSLRDAVILRRLRIGHTCVTHKYLLSGDSQPLYDKCQCSLTVKHILLECCSLKHVRENYFTCSSL